MSPVASYRSRNLHMPPAFGDQLLDFCDGNSNKTNSIHGVALNHNSAQPPPGPVPGNSKCTVEAKATVVDLSSNGHTIVWPVPP